MFLDVLVFISGVCLYLLSHLLGTGVFPPLPVTLNVRFADSRSRREASTHTPVFTMAACSTGRFAFCLRAETLGACVGPCVRPCGGPLYVDTFNLAGLPAPRLILFSWRSCGVSLTETVRPPTSEGGRIIPVRTEAPAFLACLVHTPPR